MIAAAAPRGVAVEPLEVLGVRCPPGERATGRHHVGELADGTPITLPLHLVHGARVGPTICLTASVHGDERTGVFAVNELCRSVDPAQLRGSIIAFPVVHPLAFVNDERVAVLDSSLTNMNRIFPGNAGATIAERMAAAVHAGGISRADRCIDFHDGGRDIRAQFVMVHDADDAEVAAESIAMAAAFGEGLPVHRTGKTPKAGMAGMISRAAVANGTPAICVELGGRNVVLRDDVEALVRGTRRVLVHAALLDGDDAETAVAPPRLLGEAGWCRPNRGGLWIAAVQLGDIVPPGGLVGQVLDPFGELVEEVRNEAEWSVVVISLRGNPALTTGDWAVYGARIED